MPAPYRQLKNDLNSRALKVNPKANRITLRELHSVWNLYEGKCCHCAESNPDLVTFDHVNPLELGGTNTVDNFQLLCEAANKGKGATFIDYRPKDKPRLKRPRKKRVSSSYQGGKCKAKTLDGKRCGGYAIEDSDYCFTHDPTKEDEREEAHRRGGENRPRPIHAMEYPADLDVKSAAGLLSLMEHAIKDTWTLETSVARGRTIGYLAQVQKGILEVGQLEDRVNRLEELANHGQLGKKN
jgi:5-methylcytosine-specific restriction endonuclease McrA